ncbi:MAG: hypothetical protein QW275_02020 [Candidatus Anstonellaceae archaeon]
MSMLNISKKGQLLSSELILCIAIFMASLFAFVLAWNAIFSIYSSQMQQRQIQNTLFSVSNQLILSQGDPSNWEISSLQNANSFGLANFAGEISQSKVSTLQSLNATHYSAVREGMGAGRFDVYIEVEDAENQTVLYKFGRSVGSSDSEVASASIQRLAMMEDGKLVLVKVWLWEPQR